MVWVLRGRACCWAAGEGPVVRSGWAVVGAVLTAETGEPGSSDLKLPSGEITRGNDTHRSRASSLCMTPSVYDYSAFAGLSRVDDTRDKDVPLYALLRKCRSRGLPAAMTCPRCSDDPAAMTPAEGRPRTPADRPWNDYPRDRISPQACLPREMTTPLPNPIPNGVVFM
uniref:Uncharacterized protein n=1 Tax=Knipowitschia caucasica TaxID=637954 RepID=A0AAV2MAA0_KNICA